MSHATSAPEGLRARKRAATHDRIAGEAARLASDRGVSRTTVEDIAAAADIGRSTFFRYFDTKEIAVAEGFTTPWLRLVVEALDDQPPHLDPLAAVVAAFSRFAPLVEHDHASILRQSKMSVSSAGLQAWTLHLFSRCEEAIALRIAPRFPDLRPDDMRPRMLAALTMSAVRLSTERWLASDGRDDLARLLRQALTSVSISPSLVVLPSEVPTVEEVAL